MYKNGFPFVKGYYLAACVCGTQLKAASLSDKWLSKDGLPHICDPNDRLKIKESGN
jgi:hypothetical protein